jgi:hypothetical protein
VFNLTLNIVAVLVLIPTTMFAGIVGLVGVTAAFDDISRGRVNTIAVVPLVFAGWFGIYILWRLYCFFRHPASFPPPSPPVSWIGLASGSSVSIILIATSGGSLLSRLFIFGWPLIAAIFFSILLLGRKAA